MKKTIQFLVASLVVLTTSIPVYAGVGGIGTATVNEGVFSTHLRVSYADDDESQSLDTRFRNRLMLDYGFTDDFAFGVYLQGDNRGNDNQELDAIIADARFELAEVAEHGFYSGFRLRYTFQDGDKKPDNAHIRLIAGVPVDQWDFRINQIFAYQLGEGSGGGIGVDTRLQASYKYHPEHRVGVESFSNFGFGSRNTGFDDQNHVVGPVFAGKIQEGLSYEFGSRHGISEAAADHTVRLFLTKRF